MAVTSLFGMLSDRLVFLSVAVLLSACGESSTATTDLNAGNSDSRKTLQAVHGVSTGIDDIQVKIGPTIIPKGDAQGKRDITVRNKYFALSFAVDTSSPWGVAKGGILDISINQDSKLGPDFASLVDFMPNYWSAWPSTYQKTFIEEHTAQQAVVRTQRDWGEVELDTTFTIRANSNLVKIATNMTNQSEHAIADLRSGYIAWPNGGQLFGMPGITEGDSTPISETPAFAKWSASYDRNWALALHSQNTNLVAYTGRDRYLSHVLKAGESRQFEVSLQIEANANISRFNDTEIYRLNKPSGKVYGTVLDRQGEAVADSAVIVHQNQRLHSWALVDQQGKYLLRLAEGKYQLSASAANHAPGAKHDITVAAEGKVELNLDDLEPPGIIEISVMDAGSDQDLDAMITIAEGNTPLIKYFGKSRFFTELTNVGKASLTIAPGDYVFKLSAAGGFLSSVQPLSVSVRSAEKSVVQAGVEMLAKPSARNWYAADLHHHSDVLDGFTEPEFVLRSQLAAGVDLPFLSDHDSTQNNQEMAKLAATRNLDFLPGSELSPSWAHFNVYPVDADKTVNPNIGSMTVDEIFIEARRLGAEVIHVNHPYGNYGYLDSLEQDKNRTTGSPSVVPGGYNLGFDLIEITTEHVPRTLQHAWELWNQGKPAYFAAGSDVHDVWMTAADESSAAARSYVYVEDELTQTTFVDALKSGRAYASQGPLIFPRQMFGTTLKHDSGNLLELEYEIQSVVGIKSVSLIERAEVAEVQELSEARREHNTHHISFSVMPTEDTWYSLVVEDFSGNYAYSNPLWIQASPRN